MLASSTRREVFDGRGLCNDHSGRCRSITPSSILSITSSSSAWHARLLHFTEGSQPKCIRHISKTTQLYSIVMCLLSSMCHDYMEERSATFSWIGSLLYSLHRISGRKGRQKTWAALYGHDALLPHWEAGTLDAFSSSRRTAWWHQHDEYTLGLICAGHELRGLDLAMFQKWTTIAQLASWP